MCPQFKYQKSLFYLKVTEMAHVFYKEANRFVNVPDAVALIAPQAKFSPQRIPRTVYDPASYATGAITAKFNVISLSGF